MKNEFEIDFIAEKIQKSLERTNYKSKQEMAQDILNIALNVCLRMGVSPQEFFNALVEN